MSNAISPIEFLDFSLLAFDIDLHDSLKIGVEDLDVSNNVFDLDIKPILDFDETDDGIICKCLLTVIAEVSIKDGENCYHIASIKCRIAAFSKYHEPSEDNQDLSQLVLAANTVSFVWGKIRDIVEMLSFSSSVGIISLPAIDPYAVLSDDEDDKD